MNFKVGVVYNSPSGSIRGESIDNISESEVEEQVKAVKDALEKLGFEHELFPLKGRDDVITLIRKLKDYGADVIVNLCEGAYGDSHQEMNVPALFELIGIPYTGSPPLTLGLCQNKKLAKDILIANGISTPKYEILERFDGWNNKIAYPLFVKPLMEDASIGISRLSFVRNEDELKRQVNYIIQIYKQPALIEEYISGRELNVAIIGNEDPFVLPISEIIFKFRDEPKIVDYRAKWIKDSIEYYATQPMCPTDLDSSTRKAVEEAALKAYKVLGCRDYARVDIRLREKPYVLEVNPNPDISPEAGFTRALKAANISFEKFIEMIIHFALKRKI